MFLVRKNDYFSQLQFLNSTTYEMWNSYQQSFLPYFTRKFYLFPLRLFLELRSSINIRYLRVLRMLQIIRSHLRCLYLSKQQYSGPWCLSPRTDFMARIGTLLSVFLFDWSEKGKTMFPYST